MERVYLSAGCGRKSAENEQISVLLLTTKSTSCINLALKYQQVKLESNSVFRGVDVMAKCGFSTWKWSVLVFLLTAGCAVNVDDLMKQADASLQKGNGKRAAQLLQVYLKEDPASYVAWNNLALAYRIQGRYVEAVEAHDQAIKLFPYHVDYRILKSDTLSMAGRYDDALTELDRLEQRKYRRIDNPYDVIGRKVNLYHRKHDWQRALSYLDTVNVPPDPKLYELRGDTLAQLGDRAGAAKDYQASLALKKDKNVEEKLQSMTPKKGSTQ